MEVKKTVKKIVALGIGASMLGATMLGAMAADLADYPMPFVADGVFDGVLVVGNDAKTDDVVGAIDVATGLQFSMKTVSGTGGGSSVVVLGDSYQLEESGNSLQLNESVGEIVASIDDSELNALSGGELRNQFGTHDYTEVLTLPENANVIWGVDDDFDDDEVAAHYFVAESGTMVYEYELSFTPNLEGEMNIDNNGNSEIDEIEDKSLTLFGKEYVIINADATSDTAIELELMGGSTMDTMEEGETKTYTIAGDDYEVKAVIISDTANDGDGEIKFNINGEVTDGLAEGDTFELTDGTEIGIREILPNEAGETTGGDLVEFYLGADKVKLTDDDVEEDPIVADNIAEVGDEELDQVMGGIVGSVEDYDADGSEVKISRIWLYYEASDDIYVPVGGSMSDKADEVEDEAGNFLLHGFDFTFEGLEGVDEEEWKFSPSDDRQYSLEFTNGDNVRYKWDAVYCDEMAGADGCADTGDVYLGEDKSGDDNEALVIALDSPIAKDDKFILTNDNNMDSRVFEYRGVDESDGVVQLKDIGTGSDIEASFDAPGLGVLAYATIDSQKVYFLIDDTAAENDALIEVNSTNSDASVAMGYVFTEHEGMITFTDSATATLMFSSNDDDENSPAAGWPDTLTVDMEVDGANDEMSWGWNDRNGGNYWEHSESDNQDTNKIGYTHPYGLRYEYDSDDDQETLKVFNPETYRVAQVFITAGMVTTQDIEGTAATTVTKIEVGAAKLASEIASATAQNVISIGGSCVNKVTASLLGLSYPTCGAESGVPENSAVLKLVENGDSVGLIVAGWTADDTRRATTVLGDFAAYDLSGDELWVTGTSMSDITVSAPSAAADDAGDDAGDDTTE